MTKTVAVDAHVIVPNEPEELWPFVADVNRMDHAVGLPPATFERIPRPEGGEDTWGEYRRWRILIARWLEYPFEWERPRRYSVVREYTFGPIRRFFGGAEMTATDTGTKIRVFAEFTPRNVIFVPLVRLWIAPVTMRRARRQYQTISSYLAGRSLDPFPDLAADPSHIHLDYIDRCMQRLAAEGAPLEPSTHLRRLVAEGADEDTAGMRPFQLAELWQTDGRDTLQTFLKATEAGLLDMRWELLCPSCRGVKADSTHLKELNINGFCSACNLPFAASVDEGVEARFYPNPAIREVNPGMYCVGSPMNTPHRHAQTILDPLETRDWVVHLSPGPYLIRSPQSQGVVRIQADDVKHEQPLEVALATDVVNPEMGHVSAGSAVIRLINQSDFSRTVAIDDAKWSVTAATPSRLLTTPNFNALFSAEALAPGIELSVGRVGLLFTDLAGSTALYERVGEARAFRLVTDHFQILQRSIEQAGGSIVKTIGDAVMAAFPNGASALAAGLAIQQDIRQLDTHDLADPVHLVKVGVHSGPSYLVTLNDRLDYFGTTVNVAARAQHEAHGGEVVATTAIMEEAQGLMDDSSLEIRSFEVRLRGISEPVRLFRITHVPQDASIMQGQQPVSDASVNGEV